MKMFGGAIWVWWCMMMVMLVTTPSLLLAKEQEADEVGKQLEAFNKVTFDVEKGILDISEYSSFLKNLRDALEASNKACGLPSTQSSPAKGKEYIYVELKISKTEWVTLGIDVKDMYVWGYQDNVKYDNNFRAFFLKDVGAATMNSLFPDVDAKNKKKTDFVGNYAGTNGLESAAQVTRVKLNIGIISLDSAIRSVYNKKEIKQKDMAKFFLICIQMVSEAARFKFMEQAIIDDKANFDEFKFKMVAFQNNWDEISQSIHKAEAAKPKCETITPTLIITGSVKAPYRQEVDRVDKIKGDMGILKYKKTKTSSAILMSIAATAIDKDDRSILSVLESAMM